MTQAGDLLFESFCAMASSRFVFNMRIRFLQFSLLFFWDSLYLFSHEDSLFFYFIPRQLFHCPHILTTIATVFLYRLIQPFALQLANN